MAVAMIGPKFYAWDKNGKPLAFGKLYTYEARTNTPKDTYQSEDQVVANSNPVTLNGEGYANVYLDGSYKMVLKDSDDNEIWSSDPVSSAQPSEWVNCMSATYVSSVSFKLAGNQTDKFDVGRKIRIDNNAPEYAYSSIVSSVYAAGETSIVISDAVVTTGILGVCTSIVGVNSSFNPKDIGSFSGYVFDNVASMKSSALLKEGQKAMTLGYYSPNDGGGAQYVVEASGSVDEKADHTLDAGGVAKLLIGMILDVRKFGALNNTDSTLSFQSAIDKSNSVGGIPVTGGAEAYYVSNVTSGSVEGAITMKTNVHLMLPKGAELTRPPAEREVNGRIIGTGVEANYNGPSGFKISGFKISDGDENKGARTQGDLINLNSCSDVEIYDMEFGNSDFHFVDIRGCKNVFIHDNKHNSSVVGGAAPYQFDVATNATDSAIYPNDNIHIFRNYQEKHSVAADYHQRTFEFAHQCTSKNVYIYNNVIDETNNTITNIAVIGGGGENDERFENINIFGNAFSIDNFTGWWIRINTNETNPDDGGNPNYIHGFKVYGNKFKGKTSQGIQISMVTAGMTDFGDITGVDIYDNDFEWDLAVTTSASWSGVNGELCKEFTFRNNRVKLAFGVTSYGSVKNLEMVRCNSNRQMTCVDNVIEITGTPSSNVQLRPITYYATHLVDLGLSGTWHCERNEIHGDNFSPGILLNNYAGIEPTILGGKVSRNFVHGTPQGASSHYSLGGNVFLSDGTNNLQYIDWGASGVVGETEVLALSNNFKLLNHPLPFKVENNVIPMVRGLISTTSQDLANFAMDITKQYLSATTTAGTSLEFVQGTNDDMNVLCGTDGVHMNFNETTQQPLLYASGWLRVLAGC